MSRVGILLFCLLAVTACNNKEATGQTSARAPACTAAACTVPSGTTLEPQESIAFPSPEWFAREALNFARVSDAPLSQAASPEFQLRLYEQSFANYQYSQDRLNEDPYWSTGENLCFSGGLPCAGDPFQYPGVDSFYDEEGEVSRVSFYDAEGARLSGHVWQPRNAGEAKLPGVILVNGGEATEPMYWWFARTLVRNGYVVLTYDPRGQGYSDSSAADGTNGGTRNADIYTTNLIDAVDFMLSTPANPYAHNLPGTPGYEASGGQAPTTAYNPLWEVFDADRLGLAGHSRGAQASTRVQGLQPWPGSCCSDNPVKVIVAWDYLDIDTEDPATDIEVVARVPAMNQIADYGLVPVPREAPPHPGERGEGYAIWVEAGVPVSQVALQGGSHFEWSQAAGLPMSFWQWGDGDEGWGEPMLRWYSLAWLDRWLKQPGEVGYANADERLLDDERWADRFSFYLRTGRDYPTRDGLWLHCYNVMDGCAEPTIEPLYESCSSEAIYINGECVSGTERPSIGETFSPLNLIENLIDG